MINVSFDFFRVSITHTLEISAAPESNFLASLSCRCSLCILSCREQRVTSETSLRWTVLHWVGLHLLFWMGVRWLQLCLIISLSSSTSLSFIQISFLLYVKGPCLFSTYLLRSFFHILVIVLIELTCALLSLPQWLQGVDGLPAVFVKSVSSSCS